MKMISRLAKILSSLVKGTSFVSMWLLVLEWWKFSFIRDWLEFRKSWIPPSEFWPISRDWGQLGIPNMAWMSLIKCYWMLQNAKVTAFTASELSREKQQKCKITPTPTPTTHTDTHTYIRVNSSGTSCRKKIGEKRKQSRVSY